VVLEGNDDKNPITFSVPLNYMPHIYEREGKIKNSLTVEAEYKTLKSLCRFDNSGKFKSIEWMKKDKITLTIDKNDAAVKIINNRLQQLSTPSHQKLNISEYPDFTFYWIKGSFDYSPVSERKTNIPKPFFINCIRDSNVKSSNVIKMGTCSLSFNYKDQLYITAHFSGMHLDDLNEIYQQSMDLINRFLNK
jgi:hypothetical protein